MPVPMRVLMRVPMCVPMHVHMRTHTQPRSLHRAFSQQKKNPQKKNHAAQEHKAKLLGIHGFSLFFSLFFLREHACALSGPAMPAATATLYGQEISVFVGASLTDTETHSPIQGGTDEELDFAARE